MSKESLRKRLIEAGIEEETVDARLKEAPEDVLKELTDIPTATLLKELNLKEGGKKMPPMKDEEDEEEEEETVEKEDVLYFPEETLADIAKAVVKEIGSIELEVDVASDPAFAELKEKVTSLSTLIEGMDATLKEFLGEGAPRANTVRVKRFKERASDEEGEDLSPSTARWIKSLHDAAQPNQNNGVFVDAQGNTFASMSEMVRRTS